MGIKEKLIKANEAVAAAPPPPTPSPPPPAEESPLMKAVASLPSVMGQPIALGEQNMVSRSVASLQDGILQKPSKLAQDAEERAQQLLGLATSNPLLKPGWHLEELEINDYPQIARQKISHREPLLQIEELTGAKVQVKGQFFSSNAKVPEGGRKLYVEVVGPTAIAVQKAKHEVHKMMEALAIRTLNIPGVTRAVMGTPGRYDPAVGK